MDILRIGTNGSMESRAFEMRFLKGAAVSTKTRRIKDRGVISGVLRFRIALLILAPATSRARKLYSGSGRQPNS